MHSGDRNWDDDEDDGLPDAAFTEDELAAGVQHIARTGDPNATSSYGRTYPVRADELSDDLDDEFMEGPQEFVRFDTFALALAWATANPGRSFARAADGRGFEAKPSRPSRSSREAREIRRSERQALAPHLHEVLSKSGSGRYGTVIRPFYRRTWESELDRLSVVQLRRLRSLLAVNLEEDRTYLRQLYAEMRRFPSMRRSGDYGEDLFEKLIEITRGAIADIDARLAQKKPA